MPHYKYTYTACICTVIRMSKLMRCLQRLHVYFPAKVKVLYRGKEQEKLSVRSLKTLKLSLHVRRWRNTKIALVEMFMLNKWKWYPSYICTNMQVHRSTATACQSFLNNKQRLLLRNFRCCIACGIMCCLVCGIVCRCWKHDMHVYMHYFCRCSDSIQL